MRILALDGFITRVFRVWHTILLDTFGKGRIHFEFYHTCAKTITVITCLYWRFGVQSLGVNTTVTVTISPSWQTPPQMSTQLHSLPKLGSCFWINQTKHQTLHCVLTKSTVSKVDKDSEQLMRFNWFHRVVDLAPVFFKPPNPGVSNIPIQLGTICGFFSSVKSPHNLVV